LATLHLFVCSLLSAFFIFLSKYFENHLQIKIKAVSLCPTRSPRFPLEQRAQGEPFILKSNE
jgi:hypothetical protein